MRGLFALCCLLFCALPIMAAPSAKQALQRDINYFEKSLNRHEYRQVAHMTHPKIVEAAGGVLKLRDTLKQKLSPSKLRGRIKSMDFKEPGKITKIANGLIAIVPYEATFEVKNKLYVVESFYLAWSNDQGKIWVFVDGIGAYQEGAMEQLFPGYKGELSLPERKRPYLMVK